MSPLQGGKSVQRKGTRFVADWKDAGGRRHRKTFTREMQARRFEHKMIAISKVAFELGERIGRATTRGSSRQKEARLIAEQCTKIATMVALGKKPAAKSALLEQALSA
jgi:hypothetical protein